MKYPLLFLFDLNLQVLYILLGLKFVVFIHFLVIFFILSIILNHKITILHFRVQRQCLLERLQENEQVKPSLNDNIIKFYQMPILAILIFSADILLEVLVWIIVKVMSTSL